MLDYSKFQDNSWLRWAAAKAGDAAVGIMGVPFDNAVSLNKGASKAPKHLRDLSIDLSDTTDEFLPIREDVLYDFGDIPVTLDWEAYFDQVRRAALQVLEEDIFGLFIGGDHSVTIPLHKAFGQYWRSRKESSRIGVIHMDAHYDLCPDYDGHPWSHACTEARALDEVIEGPDLTFIGVRVAELTELELMKDHPGITTHRAADVHEYGAEAIARQVIDKYRDYDAVYLTLDIDVLDPAFAPGTGTPVSGGLTPIQLLKIVRLLLSEIPVRAMDIVEVAPPLDVNDITSWAALRIIHEVFSYFSR